MVGAKVRYRSISRISDEIEEILKYGFTRLNIADDFFTFDYERVKAFCTEIKNRNLEFGWSAFARADYVNKELLETMMDAGCDSVLFGIESGNQEILDRIRKRIKLDQIRKAVADCKAVGMKVFGSLIVGLPGESSDTLMDTYRFAQELGIDYGYHFLAPFPGTTVKENIDHYDLELLTEDWSQFDANRAIVRTSRLSADEIERFVYDYYTSEVNTEEEKIARRFREGRSSDSENLFYRGKQKNQIIFKLFSEDIIEEHCVFPAISTGGDLRNQLIHKIAPILNKEITMVESVIGEIIESGFLKLRKENGKMVWYWPDNNQIDRLPT